MENEFLKSLQYLPEGGALLYGDERHLLLPLTIWSDFQKAVTDTLEAERVGQIIYASAYRLGIVSALYHQEEQSLSGDEWIRFMAHISTQSGWGRIEIISLGFGHGVLELEVYHSAFAENYRQSAHPVCHWLRGFYAGVWQAVLDRPVRGLEMSCRAVEGPGPCHFLFSAFEQQDLEVSSE